MKTQGVLAALVAGALVCASAAYAQQTAEELYQAGLYQEEVQGDLERAIDVYRGILEDFPGSRSVGAKAQLHIGLCYEKLGLQEARQAYRRVIEEFSDHTEEVGVARERLAGIERALAALDRQPTFRKIEIASKPQNGVLSPDGSRLAFISEGAVWVVPLHGKVDPDIAGEPVRIADVAGAWDNGSVGSWSANGEWIAFNSSIGEEDDSVYVVPAAGGEPRVVGMPDRGSHLWSYRVSLSPDGQNLAFSARDLGAKEKETGSPDRVIYSIPIAGGEPKRISSTWGRLPSFSPDGRWIAYVGYRERDDWRENSERSRYDGDLWVASSSGNALRIATIDGRLRGPVWSPDGKYIAAHYEPGGDNSSNEIWVFPFSPDGPSDAEPTTIALPRESFDMISGWTPSGELGVFIQAELHQAIYTVPASGGKAVQVSDERYAWYPRWSSDGERIYARAWDEESPVTLSYVPSAGGEYVGFTGEVDRALVGRVPGGGFNVSPDGERILMSAYQRPWDPEEGVDLWTIPLDGGRPTRLTRGGAFEGYPCWSPDGDWVAFTDWNMESEDAEYLAIYTVPAGGGEVRQLTAASDSVAQGAIAVSPGGQRIAFFSDGAIKTIPIGGGEPEVLVADVRYGSQSDLAWSPNGRQIAYSGSGKIWIASADGGDPQELRTGLPEETKHGSFSWSPDGQKIAFIAVRGDEAEFWLISDFLPTSEDR